MSKFKYEEKDYQDESGMCTALIQNQMVKCTRHIFDTCLYIIGKEPCRRSKDYKEQKSGTS